MKTRKQKVIRIGCIIVSIFLLASFFVVPVAALDQLTTFKISNIMYEYGSDPHDPEQRPYTSLHLIPNRAGLSLSVINSRVITQGDSENPLDIYNGYNQYMEFTFADLLDDTPYFGVYYINQLFDDNVTRTFAPGDTLFLDASFFGCWTLDDSSLTKYRFTLREYGDPYSFSVGKVVASTDIKNFLIDADSEGFDYDRLAFNFTTDIQSNSLCLCFEFETVSDGNSLEVGFESTDFKIQFGSGVSPNYPIYPAAPGGNDVGNYGSAEQELIHSQEQGLSQGANSMQSAGSNLQSLSSDLKLMSFVPVLSGVLDKIATIPGIMPLVNISLSLGLFASLMGLAASIVSAADRRAGQAKRESQRESQRQASRDAYAKLNSKITRR